MRDPLTHLDPTVENLNHQLNLPFERKIEVLNALAKTGEWSSVSNISSTEGCCDVMVELSSYPALAVTFLFFSEEDITKLHAMDMDKWAPAPGFVVYFRSEQ